MRFLVPLTKSTSIHEYWILNHKPQMNPPSLFLPLAYTTLERLMADDHFTTDEHGAIFVHVRIAESIVQEFPASFYKTPEAKEYIQANPNWREGTFSS